MTVENSKDHPLVKLYGSNALELALAEILRLREGSNIPFDSKYVELGLSLTNSKAIDIIEGNKPDKSLKSLISEGFGEAAIYKYNMVNS
jgi:hypothetical protein